MADILLMYGITTGAFVIFTGILFGVRAKRMNHMPKRLEERQAT